MKENCPVIEKPGPFSHNCAPDARSLLCLFIPPQVSGRRENSLLGRPATQQLCFITERVLCQGAVILSLIGGTM